MENNTSTERLDFERSQRIVGNVRYFYFIKDDDWDYLKLVKVTIEDLGAEDVDGIKKTPIPPEVIMNPNREEYLSGDYENEFRIDRIIDSGTSDLVANRSNMIEDLVPQNDDMSDDNIF